MKLLMYRPEHHESACVFQDKLAADFRDMEVELFETFSDLRMGLRHPAENTEIGVLMFADLQEMKEILRLKVLLKKMHLILILPEYDEAIMELAHKFHPRYIAFCDSDVSTVRGVVERLAGK